MVQRRLGAAVLFYLHHSFTPSFCHSIATSFNSSITIIVALTHFVTFTQSFHKSGSPPLYLSDIISSLHHVVSPSHNHYHSTTLSLHHAISLSCRHSGTLSLHNFFLVSFSQAGGFAVCDVCESVKDGGMKMSCRSELN